MSMRAPGRHDRTATTTGRSPFGDELEAWMRGQGERTVGSLISDFGDRSFAAAVVMLMFVPALPLPTGGVSHVFEAITIVVGAEMLLGRRTVWMPARWRRHPLSGVTTGRAMPVILRWIRRAERISRPRGARLFASRLMQRLFGAVFVVFAGAAALAPPFSGLDTLPAAGAVAVALAILFEDALLLAAGVLLGCGGVALVLVAGLALAHVVGRVV